MIYWRVLYYSNLNPILLLLLRRAAISWTPYLYDFPSLATSLLISWPWKQRVGASFFTSSLLASCDFCSISLSSATTISSSELLKSSWYYFVLRSSHATLSAYHFWQTWQAPGLDAQARCRQGPCNRARCESASSRKSDSDRYSGTFHHRSIFSFALASFRIGASRCSNDKLFGVIAVFTPQKAEPSNNHRRWWTHQTSLPVHLANSAAFSVLFLPEPMLFRGHSTFDSALFSAPWLSLVVFSRSLRPVSSRILEIRHDCAKRESFSSQYSVGNLTSACARQGASSEPSSQVSAIASWNFSWSWPPATHPYSTQHESTD